MKTLDRQKLDATNKTRSNIFGWRGQSTPVLVGEHQAQASNTRGVDRCQQHLYPHCKSESR